MFIVFGRVESPNAKMPIGAGRMVASLKVLGLSPNHQVLRGFRQCPGEGYLMIPGMAGAVTRRVRRPVRGKKVLPLRGDESTRGMAPAKASLPTTRGLNPVGGWGESPSQTFTSEGVPIPNTAQYPQILASDSVPHSMQEVIGRIYINALTNATGSYIFISAGRKMAKRIKIPTRTRDRVPLMVEIPPSLDDRMRNAVIKAGVKMWEWVSDAIERKLNKP